MSIQFSKNSQSLRGGKTRNPPCIFWGGRGTGPKKCPKCRSAWLTKYSNRSPEWWKYHAQYQRQGLRRWFHAGWNRAHTSTSVPKTTQLTTCDRRRSLLFVVGFSWKNVILGRSLLYLSYLNCFLGVRVRGGAPPPTCKGCSGQRKPWTRGSCLVQGSQSCSPSNFIRT